MADASIASLKSTLGPRMQARRAAADAKSQAGRDRERERSEEDQRTAQRHAKFHALIPETGRLNRRELGPLFKQLDLLYFHFKKIAADPSVRPDIVICPKNDNAFSDISSVLNSILEYKNIWISAMKYDRSYGPEGIEETFSFWHVRSFEDVDFSGSDPKRAATLSELGIDDEVLKAANARFMAMRVDCYLKMFADTAAAQSLFTDKFVVEPADRLDSIRVLGEVNKALKAADISYSAAFDWEVDNRSDIQRVTYRFVFTPV